MIRCVAAAGTESGIKEGLEMKIAITSQDTDLDSPIDPRFGRAAYILIVDTDSYAVEVIDNSENLNAFKGAGIQAAATLSKSGVEVLLTGYCGPNAFKTLQAAGIKVVNDISGTVKDTVDAFNKGEVTFADDANVEAHW
jgi:predicted Fe-Mo cluster-binding NifX family protein